MAKAAGIDIGSHGCKVAVVDGGPKGAKLLRFVERAYELDPGEAPTPAIVLDALRKALAEARAPRHAASLALPAEQCVLREISVPFKQDDQIAKVAKFEFEPHLHNAAIEDVVVDYVQTGPSRTGTRLLVFACMKDMLRTRLAQLGQAGVDPLHVDVDVAALFNTAAASGAFAEHPNCLIIDIGARTTKTLLIQDGRLKVARSIRLGSTSARRRLTDALDGDDDAADRALEDAAGAEALARAPVSDAGTVEIVTSVGAMEAVVARAHQEEFLQRVMRETQRTLPMMGEAQAISRIYLTGGGATQHPNAREQLAERFGAPVADLPVAGAVTHDLPPTERESFERSGAVAVGTALKVVGIDNGQVDLRREEFRFARTFDQVKNAVATGVTLAFFAVFLFWLSLFMEKQKAQRELATLQRTATEQLDAPVFDAYSESVRNARTVQVSRDPDRYFQTTKTSLARVRNHLKNELGLATEIPPIISSLEIWQAVMGAIQEVRGKIEFLAIKQEDYDQEKAVITLVVSSIEDPDTVIAALRKHTPAQGGSLFASAENRAPRTTPEGRVEVPIEITLLPRESMRAETSAVPADEPVRTADGDAR